MKNNENNLYYYENLYKDKIVAGCDEAGRGPLAGPVVSAIVILDKDSFIEGINDSKQVSPSKRKMLFEKIIDSSIDWSFGLVNNKIIDDINILQATKLSMQLAFYNLTVKPDILLLDAITISGVNCEQVSIVKGDTKSVSIAAASILAKVFRDNLMNHYNEKFPMYNFSKHKGYGTKEHRDNINKHGLSDIHRKSFKLKNN